MGEIILKNIKKSYEKGETVIENLDLTIEEGLFTVLVGASGCGKSTTLRMIAGLEKETSGEIYIDGKLMNGVEPGKRNVAMVFQNYALYPTMTVRGNIEFGLKNKKIPKVEIKKIVAEIADTVGLTEYLDKKPEQLSGGQRQRVALARAMVKKPAVFLMDEPLSNLDAKLRSQMRAELIELHQKLKATFLYVTHDQIEAMSMGDKIVLMDKGEIKQIDSPKEIYNKPQNKFTAQFIGTPPMNVLECRTLKGYEFEGKPKFLGFRPEKAKTGSNIYEFNKNAFKLNGRILTKEMLGSETLYKVKTDFGNIVVKLYENNDIESDNIVIYVDYNDLVYFDKDENRIEGVKCIAKETIYVNEEVI
ncbi:ABC transporter ATP-binding protein [Clostridium vincentii]|uniref:Trehalose import ATP-binding protein SugC n=1 Tax=Clostridium vincentii TaxID=52704 RepID=A0A2T0BIU9_9CLOT|nr:ABC transporter ATP-binding protein [Clostridium vincentii]PRR83800.1 Trehalose import ATP-binding protein SugC [Clostridium vincentii]